MVEVERPEASSWKVIAVRRKREETVELRLVNRIRSQNDGFVELTPSEARCVACLLLAAAEHPTEGRLVFKHDNPDERPLIVKRAPSGPVELRLREGGYYAEEPSLQTTRRIAHALMAESQ